MVVLDVGARPGEREGIQPPGVRRVRDVEQRGQRAECPAVRRRVLADAEQQAAAERVEVGGIAAELQLAYPDEPPDLRDELAAFFYREPYAIEPVSATEVQFKVCWDDRLVELTRRGGAPLIRHAPSERYEQQAIRVYLARIDGEWRIAR